MIHRVTACQGISFLFPPSFLFYHNVFWKPNIHLPEYSTESAALRYATSQKWHVYFFSFSVWRSVHFLDLFSLSGGVCMCKLLCFALQWLPTRSTAQAHAFQLLSMTDRQWNDKLIICLEDQCGGSLSTPAEPRPICGALVCNLLSSDTCFLIL